MSKTQKHDGFGTATTPKPAEGLRLYVTKRAPRPRRNLQRVDTRTKKCAKNDGSAPSPVHLRGPGLYPTAIKLLRLRQAQEREHAGIYNLQKGNSFPHPLWPAKLCTLCGRNAHAPHFASPAALRGSHVNLHRKLPASNAHTPMRCASSDAGSVYHLWIFQGLRGKTASAHRGTRWYQRNSGAHCCNACVLS